MSGDIKTILHGVKKVVSECHVDGSLVIFIVDFSDAFNLVDR